MNLSAAYLQKREEWKEQGEKEGRKQEREDMASNLLREGIDIEIITKVTGLTIEQVTKLRQELG